LKAIEECGTQEVVDHNLAIEALKTKLEILEAEKTRLEEEVRGLRATRSDLEIIQGKVDSLNKEVEDAKATEQLAAERALKAIETIDSLSKAVDAKRESGVALKA
jgi:hypothetical protein